MFFKINFSKSSFRNAISLSNGLDPDQDRCFVVPDDKSCYVIFSPSNCHLLTFFKITLKNNNKKKGFRII